MRANNSVVLRSVFLGVGLLMLGSAANPTTIGQASNPTSMMPSQEFDSQLTLKSANQKPLAVWECMTSWYGEDFDGQPTATGETYDMYGDTAAHPTLPLGSIVRVVNPRNHRSRIVRINDRGPYIEGRELDVSYGVAQRLGFGQRGLVKVRLELLEVPSRPVLDHRN
jgi:rare lipoprotein A